MRLRVGIFDLAAAMVVAVAILIPPRSLNVGYAYEPRPERMRDIALTQARLAAAPDDGEAADRLAKLLIEAGQTDWAIRVAGAAAGYAGSTSWRAWLAVSSGHAERIEVVDAHRYAQLALEACQAAGPVRCPDHERVRMSLYFDQLDAGVKSGIDPRLDPRGYHKAVLAAMRIIRFRGATPTPEEGGRQAPAGRADEE
jgi:hypothetical protein